MEVEIFQNTNELYNRAKTIVLTEIKKAPQMALGLAAGRTPTKLYELILEEVRQKKADLSNIKTVNLDEYVGIGQDDPQSFYTYTRNAFTNALGLDSKKTIALNGLAQNIEEECHSYEKKIEDFGGLHLQILGLGENGHIGFNEPGSSLKSNTRKVELSETTRNNIKQNFPSGAPKYGVTIGVANVLQAKKILLIATGRSKALAVKNSFYAEPSEQWPASFCQLHKEAIILIDNEAASLIS